MPFSMDTGVEVQKLFTDTFNEEQNKQHEEKLKHYSDFRDELRELRQSGHRIQGDPLPWSDDKIDLVKLRMGEITIWTGSNFTGKSLLTGQIAVSLATQHRVALASFEMKPVRTLERMQKQCLLGKNPTERSENLFFSALNLWIYAHIGQLNLPTVIGFAQYAAKQGCRHIFIDSLMMCTADDDYTAQKDIVLRLQDVAKEHNVHIHLIAHNRKPASTGHKLTRFNILGTSGISNTADNVFIVDAVDPDDLVEGEPTHFLKIDKHRHGEYKGTLAFWLDSETLQFRRSQHEPAHDYLQIRKIVRVA